MESTVKELATHMMRRLYPFKKNGQRNVGWVLHDNRKIGKYLMEDTKKFTVPKTSYR